MTLAGQVQAQGAEPDTTVRYMVNAPLVELFTSQGCPNCPTADRALGRLVESHEALALSIHVDYWDYSGWVDPFGSSDNTERQVRYKQRLDVPYVFTPQFVLNGRLVMESQAVSGLEMALKMFHREGGVVQPVIEYGAEVDQVVLPLTQISRVAIVRLVYFKPPMITVPSRGRNSGKELYNAHSVTGWEELGQWQGEAKTFGLGCRNQYGCAIILSDAESLEILATVARIDPSHR